MAFEKGKKLNKLTLEQQVELGNYLVENELTITDLYEEAEDIGDHLGFKITPANLLAVCSAFKIKVNKQTRKQINWNVKIMRALVHVVLALARSQKIPANHFETLLEYEHRIGEEDA